MWGEIIEPPPVKTTGSRFREREVQDKCKSEDEAVECHPKIYPDTRPQFQHEPMNQDLSGVSGCVDAMVKAIALTGNLVKSQQLEEAELTLDQRRQELLQQFNSRPLVFLERYHNCLKPEHLAAFAHVSSDPRTQHYSKVIQRRAAECPNKTRVKNHRYAALRALQKDGEYFSDEQMRRREPLLYEQYIGQYLTDEEVLERSQEAMLEGAPGGSGSLAHLLLNSYQERLIQHRLQEEQEREDGALEEEDDEEDDNNKVQVKEWKPTTEEKALLREEFISQMHQRFLDGKDEDFDYSEVDENPDYDNLDIVTRDAEEKYFDDDDDEDEDDNMTE